MVEAALHGRVEVNYRQTGVCWRVLSPMQYAVETV